MLPARGREKLTDGFDSVSYNSRSRRFLRRPMAPRARRRTAATQNQSHWQNAARPGRSSAPSASSQGSRLRAWLFVGVVVATAGLVYLKVIQQRRPPFLLPLDAPLVKDSAIFTDAHRNASLWGIYRPGLYFGVRMRRPSSLLAGLMWMDPTRLENLNNIRHLAKQEDGVQYGWTEHNGHDFGIQNLRDKQSGIQFATTWIQNAHDWTLRVAVESEEQSPTSFFFYLADEAGPLVKNADKLDWELLVEAVEPHGLRLLSGTHASLQDWNLALYSEQLKDLRMYQAGFPVNSYHNLTEVLKAVLYDSLNEQYQTLDSKDVSQLQMRFHEPPLWLESATEQVNLALFQIMGTPPFSFDIVFLQGDFDGNRFQSQTGPHLGTLIQTRSRAFREAFKEKFPVAEDGQSAVDSAVLRSALSNMVGGIGYFYGASKVKLASNSDAAQIVHENFQAELLTAVPSRSFFPRGFLWDEGFHLLLIHRWSPLLCQDILAHWLDLLSQDGWMAREQILGEEARARVPTEFLVQDPSVGNPPTFFLVLLEIAKQPDSEAEVFLSQAWPRLLKWFHWIVKNHRGRQSGTYRWTSREASQEKLNPLTLDSGLDDYPRASHPTELEHHLDIRCWIALAAKTLETVAKRLQKPETEIGYYGALAADLMALDPVRSLYYDAQRGWFSDYGLHSEAVRPEKIRVPSPNGEEVVTVRRVDEPPKYQLVPHFGYVSLFPLFMKLFASDDPLLQHHLRLLEDPELLWTPFGLRSLSKNSSLYQTPNTEHDPPYWRGAVWINLNFLALEALKYYAHEGGPYAKQAAELEAKLRSNVVDNVVREYERTGFFWEQYDDSTGQGKGCRPFTGWTALILLML